MRVRILRLVCLCATAAVCVMAQAPPQLVHLYVTATDAKGKPVSDLSAGDFAIKDQGKPETILFCRAPLESAAAPPAGEYTNRPNGAVPHPVAILFDLLDESRPDWLDAWQALKKAIPQVRTGEALSVYVINFKGELVPVHGIGDGSHSDRSWVETFGKDLDKVIAADGQVRPAGVKREDEVKWAYHDLELLANQLAALAGHGEIVWITDVMPFLLPPVRCSGDWVDCGLYAPHLAVTLEQDRVSVSPAFLGEALEAKVSYDLDQMALLTGGRVYARQAIGNVLDQIARTAGREYELAYAPESANWDNKWHKVHLVCERKGVKLQLRERYYALPDSRSAEARQKDILTAAYEKPGDSAGIGLRVKVSPAGKGVHLEVRVDANDLLLREQNGKWVADATLVVSDRVEAAAGGELQFRPLGEPTITNFNVELAPERLPAARKEGVAIQFNHEGGANAQRIRVVIMDRRTNSVGSVTIPAGSVKGS